MTNRVAILFTAWLLCACPMADEDTHMNAAFKMIESMGLQTTLEQIRRQVSAVPPEMLERLPQLTQETQILTQRYLSPLQVDLEAVRAKYRRLGLDVP